MKGKDNKTQIFITLIGFLGILIGTFGTLLVNYFSPISSSKIEVSTGKAQQLDGIYLFIRSQPVERYVSLGTVTDNSVVRAAKSGTGKKGLDIFKSIGKSLINDISFENRLKSIIGEAKRSKENVQGLIFSDNLNKCEAIRFK